MGWWGTINGMKSNLMNTKNTPYIVAGGVVFVGMALLIFNYWTAEPVTRDPNIGADLRQLLGVLMLVGGAAAGFILVLIRLVKRLIKK